jgi:tetratricopeptide (TPR) repeat protein
MACTTEHSTAIGDLAAGRIDPDRAAELLDHLEGCDACSEEFDLVAGLVSTSERHGADFLEPERSPDSPIRNRPWSWGPLAAAALVLVAFGLWTVWDRGGRQPASGLPTLVELAQVEPIPAPRSVLRATDTRTNDAFAAAMELYAEGEYGRAKDALAKVLTELDDEAPERALAWLYFGVANLQGPDSTGAEPALEEAARIGTGLVAERARWYLGNARLASGDVEGALAAFRDLEQLGGDYELNARQKIEAIEAASGR